MLIKSFSYLGFDVSLLLLVLSSFKFRWITNWWADIYGIISGCILVWGSFISRSDITFDFSIVVFVQWLILPSPVEIGAERFPRWRNLAWISWFKRTLSDNQEKQESGKNDVKIVD
jgi:hypothetical protein